jgi:hypothetical protein
MFFPLLAVTGNLHRVFSSGHGKLLRMNILMKLITIRIGTNGKTGI